MPSQEHGFCPKLSVSSSGRLYKVSDGSDSTFEIHVIPPSVGQAGRDRIFDVTLWRVPSLGLLEFIDERKSHSMTNTALIPAVEDQTEIQLPIRSTLPVDDPEFVEIILEFLERLPAEVRRMEAALADSEFEQLADQAHWLKGTGGTAGFMSLMPIAQSLFEAAAARQFDEASKQLKLVHETIQLIVPPDPV